MDDLGSRIKHITNELKDYVETQMELTFLNFSDKVTYLIGQSVLQLIGYAILGIGLVFAMTSLAIYLGEILEEPWAGYLIIASPFIIIGLIFIIGKPKSVAKRIQNQLLADVIDSLNESEEELKQLPVKENQSKESEKNG
ncbi:MAG: phage holin family protein [Balneolaceae bacterium]